MYSNNKDSEVLNKLPEVEKKKNVLWRLINVRENIGENKLSRRFGTGSSAEHDNNTTV